MTGRYITALIAFCLAKVATAHADVVITEIMYHPDSLHEGEEYIELRNVGESTINLGGWEFTDGIEFKFLHGTILASGERLVVCRDRDQFEAVYPDVDCVGNWEGHLKNSGERIELCNEENVTIDEVTYGDAGLWSPRADGDGQSLECIVDTEDNSTPFNWRASQLGIHGTPSEANSVEQATLPPLLTDLQYFPENPEPDSPLVVTIHVVGDAQTLMLHSLSTPSRQMRDNGLQGDETAGDGIWTARTESPNAGHRFAYWVEATTEEGAVSRFPEYAPIERVGGRVPLPTEPEDLPVWRLWVNIADLAEISSDPFSDELHHAALLIGDQYFEPVWVRPRGNNTRNFPKLSWKIFLPEWMEFEGQQTFNLNAEYTDFSMMREVLAHRFYQRVGCLASDAEPVRLMLNDGYIGVYARIENIGRRWLRRRNLDPDMDLFAARDGMFHPANVGLLQQWWDHEVEASGDAGWDRLLDTIGFINSTPFEHEDWWEQFGEEFDRDMLIRYLAARACIQAFDDKNKNLFLYAQEPLGEAPRWITIPYDLDLSWGRMWLPTEPNPTLNDRFITDLAPDFWGFPPDDINPLYRRLTECGAYSGALYDQIGMLLATEFRLGVLEPEINALFEEIREAGLADPLRRGTDEDFLAGPEELIEFVRMRREMLLNLIPPEHLVVTREQVLDHLLGIEPLVGNEVEAANTNYDEVIDVADFINAPDHP